jgi:predicted metalloprotease with PDZ domain
MSSLASAIAYRVRVVPSRHEIEVAMTVEAPLADGTVRLATPTWVPGDYSFVAFGRDVFDVRATAADTGDRLVVRRDGWQAYRAEGATGPVRIEYTAYCSSWALSEACGILGDRTGVLTGARYLYVPAAGGAVTVTYELPDGWALHHPSGARKVSELTWEYPSYEILLDTPVVMGAFELITREVRGTPFHHVFFDRPEGFDARVEEFVHQVDAVAAYYHEVFGSFPFENYTFICASNPNADWGLEHLTSTMVGTGPGVFTDTDQHDTAVRACAHELFHAWNVRRLRPAPLDRLDLQNGSFTEGLWLAEGFTRYYEFLSLTRTRVYSAEQFLSCVVNYYRHLVALPAYGRVSAIDASLATFLNHDDPYPGRVNDAIDYYASGMLIAFSLDATLRGEVPASSLDDAFAAFYRAYVGRGLGYTIADVGAFLDGIRGGLGEHVTRQAAEPGGLALVDELGRIGFTIEQETVSYLGLVMQNDTGPRIYGVLDTSPAGESGIAPEDVVTVVNGFAFELGALKWAAANEPTVTIQVLRGNQSLTYTIPVGQRTQIGKLVWTGSDEQAARIAMWLSQPFAPAPSYELPLDFYENFHGVETVI